jgi:hypothetical protein
MLTVVCVKVGKKYGPEYVNRLARAVKANLQIEHTFTCVTDDHIGLNYQDDLDITRYKLCTNMDFIPELPSWWQKMALFMSWPWNGVHLTTGKRILYLDLDVVITGPLDDLVNYPSEFAMHLDFHKPWKCASAVMVLDAGSRSWIWEHFKNNATEIMQRFHGDQAYLYHMQQEMCGWRPNMKGRPHCDFFPQGWVRSYKLHCQDGPPDDCRVVCFHGEPKPADCGGWVKERWT